MASRRHTTPLFEIVSRNGHTPPAEAPARPEPRHDPRLEPRHDSARASRAQALEPIQEVEVDAAEPAAPAYSPSREPDDTREIPRTMGRISVAGGTVRLPLNYAYIGLSGVLVLALIAWTLGYVFGGQNAEEKARHEIETAAGGPALRDPLGDATTGGASDNAGDRPTERLPGAQAPAPGVGGQAAASPALSIPAGLPAITDRRTAYLAPGGYFEGEPRTPGLNYFCLVSRLPEADAARALDFLARNGVVAMGLEHERSTANNRLFDLYTLTAIPSENFRSNETRTSHEALVAELGRRWRAEERGTSDFGQPQWYRFNP